MELPKRKNPRCKYHDYDSPGAYFITICTDKRKKLLSNIVGAIHESPEVQLTKYGQTVEKYINMLPERFGVIVDNYVIMPNHIHLVVIITDAAYLRAIRESPLRHRSIISKIVGYIKMNVSKELNNECCQDKIWQRLYHDHIIRDKQDYEKISRYIYENPLQWEYDRFFTE